MLMLLNKVPRLDWRKYHYKTVSCKTAVMSSLNPSVYLLPLIWGHVAGAAAWVEKPKIPSRHPLHPALLGGDLEAFPGQPRDIVPPACPGASSLSDRHSCTPRDQYLATLTRVHGWRIRNPTWWGNGWWYRILVVTRRWARLMTADTCCPQRPPHHLPQTEAEGTETKKTTQGFSNKITGF